MVSSNPANDARLAALTTWIGQLYGRSIELEPASDDASFRRYFRLRIGVRSFIAMDAPPEKENSLPFVRVAAHLDRVGLNAVRVIESDLEQGFLLLTDLGSTEYLTALRADPELAQTLYAPAIDALLTLQQAGADYAGELPPYDEALLRFEMSLFHDWLCGTHLGLELDAADEAAWQILTDLLVDNARTQPQVYVHRDYHSRNLMVQPDTNPGILDFQDAVRGPLSYDLVSLLKDCYIRWPAEQVVAWASGFHARAQQMGLTDADTDTFMRQFELMGVQRHLKASGIFARLCHRDGKRRYLDDIPRTLDYILELEPRYPELAFLCELIRERCLPGLAQSAAGLAS